MWFAAKEDEVRRIQAQGFSCLERGDAAGAIAKGEELLSLRWSGGFELVALGKRMHGDHEGALATLVEAAAVAPGNWPLTQLRGNVLDQLGRGEEALAAYDEALSMPEAWRGSIHYNRAVTNATLSRWGAALADAEQALEDARDAPFALRAVELAVEALGHLNRHEDALALLNHVSGTGVSGTLAPEAFLDVLVGALRRAGRPDEEIGRAAERAVQAGAAKLETARALSPASSVAARKRLRVVLRGAASMPEHPEITGFLRPATVRATGEVEALALLSRLEPSQTRAALSFELVEMLAEELGPAEVLHLAGRVYFGEE